MVDTNTENEPFEFITAVVAYCDSGQLLFERFSSGNFGNHKSKFAQLQIKIISCNRTVLYFTVVS